MTPQDVCDIISRITYKPGWSVLMGFDGDRTFLQLEVSIESDATLDSEKRDGTRTPWKSAKRYLSPHMCRQEVVGVVFGLIKDAELHEVHEWFRYRGASIFNPHLDPDVLAQSAARSSSTLAPTLSAVWLTHSGRSPSVKSSVQIATVS